MKKYWSMIKPVLVLTLICVIASGLLAVTNDITAPIIEANAIAAQNATKVALLPTADTFEDLDISELKGVTAASKAANGAGYVITGSASGYDGQLPVTVAFDNDGNIIAVEITGTNETPGLGKKVEDDSFKSQFAGMTAEPKALSDIDAISGATISSNAVIAALNNAIEAYKVFSGTAAEKVDPKLMLMPDAQGFTEMDASAYENVSAVWKEDSGIGYIIVGFAKGYHGDLPVMVAFDMNGMIIGVEIADTEETPGLGKQVETPEFKAQFAGMAAEPFTLKDMDAIANATISCKAVKDAMNSAIEAYNTIQGVK